jgi:autotransporter translocation and assembly factor TamB
LSKFRVAAAEDFRSSLSGRLKLGGAAAAPVLSGSLEVRNSDFYLQAKNLQQSAEAVELSPEDLVTLDRRFGYSVAGRAAEKRKPLAPWSIDLKVQLAENNWLRRRSDPVMAVELGGKLDVRKAPGEDINVFGEIQPLPGRSFVQVMGRRFDLREGAVNLSGPLAQTAVALKAEYRASSPSGTQPVVITTAVQSDSGKLTVTLSSIPVMRAEDIMSYLTTGRPASTDPTLASDEQGALSTSASLAVGAALGTVAGTAGQKLGFDVVQVLQDREGGQTLVAGKYVSPPLYLGFRQPIVPATDPGRSDTETDVVEFEVEYAALRQLLLNLQGGGSEFRIFLRLRR